MNGRWNTSSDNLSVSATYHQNKSTAVDAEQPQTWWYDDPYYQQASIICRLLLALCYWNAMRGDVVIPVFEMLRCWFLDFLAGVWEVTSARVFSRREFFPWVVLRGDNACIGISLSRVRECWYEWLKNQETNVNAGMCTKLYCYRTWFVRWLLLEYKNVMHSWTLHGIVMWLREAATWRGNIENENRK